MRLLWTLAATLAAPLAWAEDFMPFSATVNLAARAVQEDTPRLPGAETIDDGAYAVALSYALAPGDDPSGVPERTVAYVLLRMFKSLELHAGTGGSFDAAGVSSIKGMEVLYGQRHFFAAGRRDGLGAGWYGGVARISEQWVNQCCGATPTTDTSTTPVVGVEVFYKLDLWRNVYLEPGTRINYRKARASKLSFPVALNLGAQF